MTSSKDNFVFARSAQNIPIFAHRFGNAGPRVLILGGVHGDETEGVVASQGLYSSFLQSFPFKLQLTLVPAFNIDGVLAKTRGNSHGVDLNRNLPTKDWSPEVKTLRYHPGPHALSEPENQGLVEFLKNEPQDLIISLHSWNPMLNVNVNINGRAHCMKVAEAIAAHTGYKIDPDIGYPTPGCLGTYTGLERDMPTITYEIERGQKPEDVLKMHVPAILAGLKVFATGGV